MQRLNDVKQYKVRLLDMGWKVAAQFLIFSFQKGRRGYVRLFC